MSAPDVERLAGVLAEIVIGQCHGYSSGPGRVVADAARALKEALSSRPDPLPASADIAGRLAAALEDAVQWIENNGPKGSKHIVRNMRWRDTLLAYRANPSGWIPDKCLACNGRGEIGGWVGQTAESGGYDTVLCEACGGSGRQTKADGWIPVEERLPEDDRTVPVVVEKQPRFGYYNHEVGRWFIREYGWNAHYAEVTYWFDIPPPPQDEHSGRIYTDPEEIEAAQKQIREGSKG